MKKKYSESLPEYDKVEFDEEAVLKSRKVGRNITTRISLPSEVIEELKALAEKKGTRYQVLMRSFILEGLEKMKKVS